MQIHRSWIDYDEAVVFEPMQYHYLSVETVCFLVTWRAYLDILQIVRLLKRKHLDKYIFIVLGFFTARKKFKKLKVQAPNRS